MLSTRGAQVVTNASDVAIRNFLLLSESFG